MRERLSNLKSQRKHAKRRRRARRERLTFEALWSRSRASPLYPWAPSCRWFWRRRAARLLFSTRRAELARKRLCCIQHARRQKKRAKVRSWNENRRRHIIYINTHTQTTRNKNNLRWSLQSYDLKPPRPFTIKQQQLRWRSVSFLRYHNDRPLIHYSFFISFRDYTYDFGIKFDKANNKLSSSYF